MAKHTRRTVEDFKADVERNRRAHSVGAAATSEAAPDALTVLRIPLAQLHIDPMNARRINREPTPEFVASVAHVGIKQPMLARKNGAGFGIVAGGKRFQAAVICSKDGRLPTDYAAPCVVENLTDAEAREISGIENIMREDMHPVDEFRFYADLHSDKDRPLSVEEIATHYTGGDVKRVERRLALGMLSDVILDAWRDGKIDVEVAKAFTLAPGGQKEQAAVFAKLKKQGGIMNRYTVRAAFKVSDAQTLRLLNLVGQAEYEKRGGKVHRDLFGEAGNGEQTGVVLSDHALLKTLVDERVAAASKALMDDGWGFVLPKPHDSHRYGQLAKPKGAKRKAGYSAEQKKNAGCFLTLGNDGALQVEYGVTKPKDPEEVSRAVATVTRRALGKSEGEKKGPATLSRALVQRLQQQLAAATRDALLIEAEKRWPGAAGALSVLTARMVANQIDPERPYATPHAIARQSNALREAVTPRVMKAALRKRFDAKDYVASAPKAYVLRAIRETKGEAAAKELGTAKRAEINAAALASIAKAGWLPAELRTGPVEKANGKRAAKSKSSKRK
jgi:ParB family transcriptional regulator, chromosome partitioning protein